MEGSPNASPEDTCQVEAASASAGPVIDQAASSSSRTITSRSAALVKNRAPSNLQRASSRGIPGGEQRVDKEDEAVEPESCSDFAEPSVELFSSPHVLPLDPATSGRFLKLISANAHSVSCHTNCRQDAQGTAFLGGLEGASSFSIKCTSKPGRMRYLIGLTEKLFPGDAGCADIAKNSLVSLENLKADLHRNGKICTASAPPSFHGGSCVRVEWRPLHGSNNNAVEFEAQISVDTTNFVRSCRVKRANPRGPLYGFVSLYNREALFEVIC